MALNSNSVYTGISFSKMPSKAEARWKTGVSKTLRVKI